MKKSIQHGADALFLRQRLPLSGNGRCRFFRCGGNFRRSFTIFIYAVKTKADGNRIIDPLHKYVVKVSHFFTKSCLVYGSNLFEQNDGILDKPILFSVNVNMRWQLCFPELACDGGGNYGWTVLVSDVVLHNQYRTKTALFASDDRTEIRIVNISAFDGQFDSLSLFSYFRRASFAFRLYFYQLISFFNQENQETDCQIMTKYGFVIPWQDKSCPCCNF